MSASITGKEWPVGGLFGRAFVFQIPPYQRPYAWEEEQAQELFDDLVAALGDTPSNKLESAPPYFLGSIVVIKDENKADAEVVDGQQRLTTLTVLLAALRSAIDVKNVRDSIAGLIYDPEDQLFMTPARFRLTLRKRDEDFFRRHIQRDEAVSAIDTLNIGGLSDSQQHLVKNARLLLGRVRALSMERRVALARYLTLRCYLVVVSTPTFESAYRIFAVLNDRGLDLTHADVLKAEVLGAVADDTDRDAYAVKWEETEELLGRDTFRDLFSHIRTIFVRKKLERTVLAELKDVVQPSARPAWFVDDVVLPYAEALQIVRSAGYQSTEDASDVNGSLRWLRTIDNADWEPVAILLVAKYQSDPAALLQTVGALDRLASVLMVGRADINERIRRYAAVLETLMNAGNSLEVVTAALLPTTDEVRRAMAIVEGPLYENTKVRAHVLLRLDALLSGAKAPHPRENPTVEHVLPQTPELGSRWLTWWPDEAERQTWTHRLGNLLLLTRRKNSQASRFEFDEKKVKYFQTRGGVSDYPLTTVVLQEKEWTPEVVARRQADLAGRLARYWSGS